MKKGSVDLNFQLQVFASEVSGKYLHLPELCVIILQKTVCKLNNLVNSYAAFQWRQLAVSGSQYVSFVGKACLTLAADLTSSCVSRYTISDVNGSSRLRMILNVLKKAITFIFSFQIWPGMKGIS